MPPYIARETKVCGDCVHFRQHYVKLGIDYYSPIEYGHCTYPRCKRRTTGDTCPRWEPAAEEESTSLLLPEDDLPFWF